MRWLFAGPWSLRCVCGRAILLLSTVVKVNDNIVAGRLRVQVDRQVPGEHVGNLQDFSTETATTAVREFA